MPLVMSLYSAADTEALHDYIVTRVVPRGSAVDVSPHYQLPCLFCHRQFLDSKPFKAPCPGHTLVQVPYL